MICVLPFQILPVSLHFQVRTTSVGVPDCPGMDALRICSSDQGADGRKK